MFYETSRILGDKTCVEIRNHKIQNNNHRLVINFQLILNFESFNQCN